MAGTFAVTAPVTVSHHRGLLELYLRAFAPTDSVVLHLARTRPVSRDVAPRTRERKICLRKRESLSEKSSSCGTQWPPVRGVCFPPRFCGCHHLCDCSPEGYLLSPNTSGPFAPPSRSPSALFHPLLLLPTSSYQLNPSQILSTAPRPPRSPRWSYPSTDP